MKCKSYLFTGTACCALFLFIGLRSLGIIRETRIEFILRVWHEERTSKKNWLIKSELSCESASPIHTDACIFRFANGEYGFVNFGEYSKTKAVLNTGLFAVTNGVFSWSNVITNHSAKFSFIRKNSELPCGRYLFSWIAPNTICFSPDVMTHAAIVPYLAVVDGHTNLIDTANWIKMIVPAQ